LQRWAPTVVDEVYAAKYGAIFYELDKFPNCFYHKAMFVEIPNSSAEEMAEEELFIYDQLSC
jgi:hypothetical protein